MNLTAGLMLEIIFDHWNLSEDRKGLGAEPKLWFQPGLTFLNVVCMYWNDMTINRQVN